MNCHGNNNSNCDKNGKPHKHMLHMLICCGLPVLIILSLPLIARFSPVTAATLGVIAPFLCPIMMVGMMVLMFKKDKNKNSDETLSQ